MQVPLTEGQAFWREWDYWQAAEGLLKKPVLDDTEKNYLLLYGNTTAEQAQAVLATHFETYVWRVVRHVRTMFDVQVNTGRCTVVDFLDRVSKQTGLSEEFLFGECFTFLAQPGYAPAYAIDGIAYGRLQQDAVARGESVMAFNTRASALGFYPWTTCVEKLTRK